MLRYMPQAEAEVKSSGAGVVPKIGGGAGAVRKAHAQTQRVRREAESVRIRRAGAKAEDRRARRGKRAHSATI